MLVTSEQIIFRDIHDAIEGEKIRFCWSALTCACSLVSLFDSTCSAISDESVRLSYVMVRMLF